MISLSDWSLVSTRMLTRLVLGKSVLCLVSIALLVTPSPTAPTVTLWYVLKYCIKDMD
jgi:hypothetical protein